MTHGQKWDYPLGSLPDEDLDWLRENGEILDLEAGAEVLTVGEEVESVFIILDGDMEWDIPQESVGCLARLVGWFGYKKPHVGAPSTYYEPFHCEGGLCDFGGDGTFLYPGSAVATLRAAGPSKVLSVSHDRLRAHCDEDLGFSARFHRMIAQYCVLRDRYEKSGGIEHVELKDGSRRALARLLNT